MATTMLMRRLRNITATTLKPKTTAHHLFSFSLEKHPLFPSSASPTSTTPIVNDGNDAVGGDFGDASSGEDVLLYPSAFVPSSGTSTVTMPNLLQPRAVLYDGVCHLCHRGVKWVIEADKYSKIKFCCLQSKAAEPYLRLCGLERGDVLRRFLFVEGYGLHHQGSTAALRVLSYLPLPYSALSVLLIVPTPLRDAVYDYVAQRRYDWFGKADDCLVLREQDLLDRFIDRDEMLEKSRSQL